MIDYEYKDLFLQDSIEKQLTISYGNVVITNEDLFNQEMTLEESLCSDQQLTFGSCEASVIKFKVANIVAPVKNQWITVKMTLEGSNGSPFNIGTYKVESDKPTADRKWREIVAYDAMYDIINSDVIGWYNSVLPDSGSSMTVKQLRTSFLGHFGIEQENVSLVNDGVVIKRTVNAEELSGATVIKAICEMNGCFGHIGRDGIFHYIHLVQGMQGLYPRNDLYPADNLYPRDPKTAPIPKNLYISCTYEDFITNEIGKLQIVNGSTGVVSSVGNGENCYVIESNFLLSDKAEGELNEIGKRILEKIRAISYRPFDAECLGNPCFDVGDPVRLSTTYEIVETYILKRTLKGIQALKDSYSSDGVEKYEIKVNSIDRAVGQLNDKTDSLEEDVGTINEDIDGINGEIEEINEDVGELHISLQKTEEGLEAEVSRATAAEGNLSSRITMTADEITAEVSRATSAENNLSSRITMTADDITAEVSRATAAEGNLSSRITINANGISTKVEKGDVVSEINQSPDKIILNSNRLVVNSSNFSLDANGNATFSGMLNGASGVFNGNLSAYGIARFFQLESYDGNMYLNDSQLYMESNGEIILDGNSSLTTYKIYGSSVNDRLTLYSSYRLSSGVTLAYSSSGSNNFRPVYADSINCGSSSYPWSDVYSTNGGIQKSDRNEKMDIKDMTEEFAENLIDGTIAKTYKFIKGSSGRTHCGMIAQDVEEQLLSMGISTKDFAGFIKHEKEANDVPTGEYGYGLRYTEYIAPMIKYCQMLKKEIEKLKQTIKEV